MSPSPGKAMHLFKLRNLCDELHGKLPPAFQVFSMSFTLLRSIKIFHASVASNEARNMVTLTPEVLGCTQLKPLGTYLSTQTSGNSPEHVHFWCVPEL